MRTKFEFLLNNGETAVVEADDQLEAMGEVLDHLGVKLVSSVGIPDEVVESIPPSNVINFAEHVARRKALVKV